MAAASNILSQSFSTHHLRKTQPLTLTLPSIPLVSDLAQSMQTTEQSSTVESSGSRRSNFTEASLSKRLMASIAYLRSTD